MAKKPKLTPMFEQYLSIKEEYPDALLFYRMGDFYELFFDDAEVAARELQIALTCRNPNQEVKVPMCGVPHHAVQGYLPQLLEKGYKVAICDQVEDPRQAKGIVKREVTRVLTPGTVVEDSNLSAKVHNYLAAMVWKAASSESGNNSSGIGALAWIDFSTGQWTGFESRSKETLWQWMEKIDPSEALLPEGLDPARGQIGHSLQVTHVPERGYFDLKGAASKLETALNIASLDVLDLQDKPQLTRCCGAILTYLRQTQKMDVGHLGTFSPLNLSKFLILDEVTERNLEIFRTLDGRRGKGTLIHALDRTVTPMGGRLLEERLRQPWRDPAPIERNQAAVAYYVEHPALREELRTKLDTIYDLERLSTRVTLGRATPKDFVALKVSLSELPAVRDNVVLPDGDIPAQLKSVLSGWDDMADLAELLNKALADNPPPVITEGGLFRSGYNVELDELLELTEHGEGKLQGLLEREREQWDIPKLKLGYNRVFGYYLELSKAVRADIPEHFERRQTLVNSERYITAELKELEEKLLSSSDRRKSLEYNLFMELRDILADARPRLVEMGGRIAGLDYWQGLAQAAEENDWTRPEIHTGPEIMIRAGRHPVVEAVQGASSFIPNDLRLDPSSRLQLITGPNMAGKSTVLRQSAIILILAQIGGYVPAAEANLGIADRIFSRVGASDNLAQGQSTFMVEMTETARILRQATRRSFVILDEIGRGTSTFDGLALAWAVVEELSRRSSGTIRTLFATHYHELTQLEGKIDGVRNFNIAIKEWKGDIVFLRRLVPGPSSRSYGIEVARLAGVPQTVVQRAKDILLKLETERDENQAARKALAAKQVCLPGMAPAGPEAGMAVADHSIILDLREVAVETLTPIQALNILSGLVERAREEGK